MRIAASGSNPALTVTASSTVTTHVFVPLQAPPHPVKVDPGLGKAVRVTFVPDGNAAAHTPDAAPASKAQSIPAGAAVTCPAPEPLPVTVRVKGTSSKAAPTFRA